MDGVVMSAERARQQDRARVQEYVDLMVDTYRELLDIPADQEVSVSYGVYPSTGTMQVTFKVVK
jgi:hypothetical protein